MNPEVRNDLKRLLPVSVVILVYGWYATDLTLLSSMITLLLSWIGFMVAGVAGMSFMRKHTRYVE